MHLHEKAIFCWKSNTVNSESCLRPIKYTIKHITPIYDDSKQDFFKNFDPADSYKYEKFFKDFKPNDSYISLVYEQINNIRKKRVETRIFTMPILGLSLDVNDLSFISCVIFAILYIILYGYISREYYTYRLIIDPGDRLVEQLRSMYSVLYSSQVLSNIHLRFVVYILISLPSFCSIMILFHPDPNFGLRIYERIFEYICVLLSVFFLAASLFRWHELNKLLDNMSITPLSE